MDSPRERDQFARIELYGEVEKARQLIGKYQEGMAYWHNRIEKYMRAIGRLDERLGEG